MWYLISPSNEAESQNVRIPANNHNHDHTGFGQIVQPPDKGQRASIVTQLRRCVSSGSGWTNRGCDIEMWIPIVILPEVDHGLRLKVWQSVVMCPKWLHTVIHLNVEYKGITTWHSYADQVQLLKSGIQWNENTILCQANRIFHTRWKGTKLPKSYPRNTYNVWRNTKTRIFTATRWDAACLLRGRGSWRRRRWGGREGGRVGKRFS